MSTPSRLLLTLGLIVAAGAAGYWFGKQQNSGADQPAKPEATAMTGETARLRDEVTRLRADNERLAKAPVAIEPVATAARMPPASDEHATRMAQLHALAEAQKAKTANVNLPVVGRDGKLAPGFAKMFDLTPAEDEALQQAVAQGRQQIDGLMAANATVTPTGDTIVVAVKPFTGGGDVYDTLMDGFARTLGPERNEMFLALQTDQLSRAFSNFGGEERTLTFSRQAAPDGKDPQLSLRDMQKAPRSTSASVMTYPDLSKLPAQYAWVVPLVPQVSNLPVRPRTVNNLPDTIRP